MNFACRCVKAVLCVYCVAVPFSKPLQFHTCSSIKKLQYSKEESKEKYCTVQLSASPLADFSPSTTMALVLLSGAVLGTTAVTVGAPFVLGALGFGTTVAAGSWAASMMSAAWTTGYGVGAVAALQSAGAAGVGAASYIGGAATGAGLMLLI